MPPVKPVQATLDDFELGEEVAWGSLATVCYLLLQDPRLLFRTQIVDAVYKKNKKHYALKVLNKAQLVRKKVIRSALVEKDALVTLGTRPHQHPGVIRLHHCFQDETHLCEFPCRYTSPYCRTYSQTLPWIWQLMVI